MTVGCQSGGAASPGPKKTSITIWIFRRVGGGCSLLRTALHLESLLHRDSTGNFAAQVLKRLDWWVRSPRKSADQAPKFPISRRRDFCAKYRDGMGRTYGGIALPIE